MKLLELFSGTGSIGTVAESLNWEVRNLDFSPKRRVTYNMNILDFDPNIELKDWIPDIVWASPCCTHYSKAKSCGVRDIEGSNKLVTKTLDIIDYVKQRNPALIWFIENPQTGLLKNQPMMKGLDFYDCDYCAYGYNYRKRTRIWTNKKDLTLKLCPGAGKCHAMEDRRHIGSCGCGGSGGGHKSVVYSKRNYSQDEKYSIPPDLIHTLLTV